MLMVVLSLQCVLIGMSILGKDDCEMISDGVLLLAPWFSTRVLPVQFKGSHINYTNAIICSNF